MEPKQTENCYTHKAGLYITLRFSVQALLGKIDFSYAKNKLEITHSQRAADSCENKRVSLWKNSTFCVSNTPQKSPSLGPSLHACQMYKNHFHFCDKSNKRKHGQFMPKRESLSRFVVTATRRLSWFGGSLVATGGDEMACETGGGFVLEIGRREACRAGVETSDVLQTRESVLPLHVTCVHALHAHAQCCM